MEAVVRNQIVTNNGPLPASEASKRQVFLDSTMMNVMDKGRRFIDRGLPVLLLGETGTGKEVVARKLHEYSARRLKPLVTLNCASIPDSLAESELFGYVRGAFSGALQKGRKGKIEAAHGGTLFLDEIGDMPLNQQSRLLRALSEREITPLGTTEPVSVEFQLICATHQNLPALIDEGIFRSDLYYRIAEGTLHLPPLRERTDIRSLVMQICAEEVGQPVLLEQKAWDMVLSFGWPGNVRQLRGALRCACALSTDRILRFSDFPDDVTSPPRSNIVRTLLRGSTNSTVTLDPCGHKRETHKRDRVVRVLTHTRWNMSAAARDLGICRSTLYRQLKSLGIPHIKDVERS